VSRLVVSSNEIDALAKKAAKGAGMPWGLAAEAGKATRWLADRGLPGPAVLADLLDWRDGRPIAAVSPPDVSLDWAGHDAVFDAVVVGTVCADLAPRLAVSPASLGTVRGPLLLGFAVSVASRRTGVGLVATWHDVTIGVDGEGVRVTGSAEGLRVAEADVSIDIGTPPGPALAAPGYGCDVDEAVWARIERHAARTYAPETERSRLTGAGAGLIDD